MIVDTNDLISVKTYADYKGVSTTTVYNWIVQRKVKGTKIDEFAFVILDKDEKERYKKTKNENGK